LISLCARSNSKRDSSGIPEISGASLASASFFFKKENQREKKNQGDSSGIPGISGPVSYADEC
jgi:hypothetical protein